MFEEYLPDLDQYSEAWVANTNASMRKKELENEWDEITAQVYIDCATNSEFKVGGKFPAVSLIKESYAKIGHTPSTVEILHKIRLALVEVEGVLKQTAGIIKLQEMKLSLYQTMSANSRNIQGY